MNIESSECFELQNGFFCVCRLVTVAITYSACFVLLKIENWDAMLFVLDVCVWEPVDSPWMLILWFSLCSFLAVVVVVAETFCICVAVDADSMRRHTFLSRIVDGNYGINDIKSIKIRSVIVVTVDSYKLFWCHSTTISAVLSFLSRALHRMHRSAQLFHFFSAFFSLSLSSSGSFSRTQSDKGMACTRALNARTETTHFSVQLTAMYNSMNIWAPNIIPLFCIAPIASQNYIILTAKFIQIKFADGNAPNANRTILGTMVMNMKRRPLAMYDKTGWRRRFVLVRDENDRKSWMSNGNQTTSKCNGK